MSSARIIMLSSSSVLSWKDGKKFFLQVTPVSAWYLYCHLIFQFREIDPQLHNQLFSKSAHMILESLLNPCVSYLLPWALRNFLSLLMLTYPVISPRCLWKSNSPCVTKHCMCPKYSLASKVFTWTFSPHWKNSFPTELLKVNSLFLVYWWKQW